MELDELIDRRKALTLGLAAHEASLRRFWPRDKRPSFVIDRAELATLPPDDGARPLHLTSSASCLESLADREPRLAGRLPCTSDGVQWEEVAEKFARRALATPPRGWISDKAAHIYCRVRALPGVLRFAPVLPDSDDLRAAAKQRLEEAFAVVSTRTAATDRGLGEHRLTDSGKLAKTGEDVYPANAFHAYWGAKAQAEYQARSASRDDLDPLSPAHIRRVAENNAWARSAMTRHTALLVGGKRRGDAQQLVFALLTDLLANNGRLTPASDRYNLYEVALSAFFGAQEQSGRWPQSAPLFHYPNSGNAYCYTYETLTELLRPALLRDDGHALRSLLEPHLLELFLAWEYATETRVPLDGTSGDTVGWCSNHHVTRTEPEAWATAEVFSFGQLLRCVAGHITAKRAADALKVRRPDYATRAAAEDTLAERGDTWTTTGWTVGRQLASMFLHPIYMLETTEDSAVRDPRRPGHRRKQREIGGALRAAGHRQDDDRGVARGSARLAVHRDPRL